jgi:hypothetical protein
LKLLGQAFNEVRQQIGDHYTDKAVEHRRTLGELDGSRERC